MDFIQPTSNKSFYKFYHIWFDNELDELKKKVQDIFQTKDKELSFLRDSNPVEYLLDELSEDDRYEFRSKVYEECKNNMWYAFREVYRYPTKTAITYNEYINCPQFHLTQASWMMLQAYQKGINFSYNMNDRNMCDIVHDTLLLLAHYIRNCRSSSEEEVYILDFIHAQAFHDAAVRGIYRCNAVMFNNFTYENEHPYDYFIKGIGSFPFGFPDKHIDQGWVQLCSKFNANPNKKYVFIIIRPNDMEHDENILKRYPFMYDIFKFIRILGKRFRGRVQILEDVYHINIDKDIDFTDPLIYEGMDSINETLLTDEPLPGFIYTNEKRISQITKSEKEFLFDATTNEQSVSE